MKVADYALIAAASCGNAAGCADALRSGADVNAMEGRALIEAAARSRQDIVSLLLEARIDIRAYGADALTAAVRSGGGVVVNMLLAAGVPPHAEALGTAVVRGLIAVAHALLDAGCDPNEQGGHALYMAAWGGDISLIRALARAGGRMEGLPLLGLAISQGKSAAAKELLRYGATLAPEHVGPFIKGRYLTPVDQLELLQLVLDRPGCMTSATAAKLSDRILQTTNPSLEPLRQRLRVQVEAAVNASSTLEPP